MLTSRSLLSLCSVVVLIAGLVAIYAAGADLISRERHGTESVPVTDHALQGSVYQCPMHPEVRQDHPGRCPICGMDLVRQSDGHNHSHSAVSIAPHVQLNLGIRTHVARVVDMPQAIETIGKITRIDAMGRRVITPPIDGELIDIADKQEGDRVGAGEWLFSVRSDALFELEKAFQEATAAADAVEADHLAAQLLRMGLKREQLDRLESGASPDLPVKVMAPEEGYIYTRRGDAGQRVHDRFTVFNIGGNGRVIHLTAEIFERQWGMVKVGQTARITVRGLPGVVFEGTVVRVEPPVGYTTRSLEVGIEFKTDHPRLSPSQFAHVSIEGELLKKRLMVPAHSVIRTGHGDRVVVQREEGWFLPVDVTIGEEAGGLIEILSGLSEGDRVVSSGQFLVDSESHLESGLDRLSHHHDQNDRIAVNHGH